jgi:hypothetical protein
MKKRRNDPQFPFSRRIIISQLLTLAISNKSSRLI